MTTLTRSQRSRHGDNVRYQILNNDQSAIVEHNEITDDTSFETLFLSFGDGRENMSHFDEGWLVAKGFTTNIVDNCQCSICLGQVKKGTEIYNIKCGAKVLHPLHKHCAKQLIESKATTCPACRFVWE